MKTSNPIDLLSLVVGFDAGLYTRDDVSTWVYAEVERHEVLSGALLELTTLHGKDDVEIARLLRSVAPPTTAFPKTHTAKPSASKIRSSWRRLEFTAPSPTRS